METEPLVQDDEIGKMQEENLRKKIVKVEETIFYSIKRKFVETEPPVQDDVIGKVDDVKMVCAKEIEPLVQGKVEVVNKRNVL